MRKLKIILGPTAVGKSEYAVSEALRVGSPVISCDSRQMYREMSIGTAVPSPEQLSAVRHYFIQNISVTEPYTAGRYELDALALVTRLFDEGHETLIMCGGSGFYIDAFCNGLDDFPQADLKLRNELTSMVRHGRLDELVVRLQSLDPETCETIDLSNGQRVVRALEVCIMTGRKFSSFKSNRTKSRDFVIEKIGLTMPRERLYSKIGRRVDSMIDAGLVDEVRSLVQYRDLPALQTVGYREIFDWFDFLDGKVSLDGWGPTSPGDGPVTSLERAAELIRRDTRHYAKRQLSYWRRDNSINWITV